DSLMDFSKPEPEYISFDLRHLVDDLLFSLRIQPRFKLIHFTINLPDDLPNIEMDVGQIQQVLMNLLNNAADAISDQPDKSDDKEPVKGDIGISGQYNPDAEQVTITLSDNGSGMSEETLGKIFTLHFSTKKGGHGLGLHNCQKIVEMHGGRLEASSEEGKGTQFRLILPRFQASPKR
ncbi:MAG: ATP-binding protein, partial [candidate division Zixibacteria bacterium]